MHKGRGKKSGLMVSTTCTCGAANSVTAVQKKMVEVVLAVAVAEVAVLSMESCS